MSNKKSYEELRDERIDSIANKFNQTTGLAMIDYPDEFIAWFKSYGYSIESNDLWQAIKEVIHERFMMNDIDISTKIFKLSNKMSQADDTSEKLTETHSETTNTLNLPKPYKDDVNKVRRVKRKKRYY